MHITIAHRKTIQQAIEAADRAVDQMFKGLPVGPVEIIQQQKEWRGPVMTFGLTAKMGFMRYPVRGTVEVMERQCVVDVDLFMLDRLLPNGKAQKSIEARIRGLLA